MKIKILFFIFSIFFIVESCTKDSIEVIITPPLPVNTSVKFSTDVYPIFANHGCTACHNPSGSAGSYVILSGNASVVRGNLLSSGAVVANNPTGSKLYTKFANGTAHNGLTLSTNEQNNIKSWINLGALDN